MATKGTKKSGSAQPKKPHYADQYEDCVGMVDTKTGTIHVVGKNHPYTKDPRYKPVGKK